MTSAVYHGRKASNQTNRHTEVHRLCTETKKASCGNSIAVISCQFWCQSFGGVSSFLFYLIILFLVRFGLLSGYLLWKELLIRLTICSLYILSICNFSSFPARFVF